MEGTFRVYVFPPYPQDSQNRLQIHCDPDQDKAVTQYEQINEYLIWTFGLFLKKQLEPLLSLTEIDS